MLVTIIWLVFEGSSDVISIRPIIATAVWPDMGHTFKTKSCFFFAKTTICYLYLCLINLFEEKQKEKDKSKKTFVNIFLSVQFDQNVQTSSDSRRLCDRIPSHRGDLRQVLQGLWRHRVSRVLLRDRTTLLLWWNERNLLLRQEMWNQVRYSLNKNIFQETVTNCQVIYIGNIFIGQSFWDFRHFF